MESIWRSLQIRILFIIFFVLFICEARRRKSKQGIQSRETNVFNFVRLLVLRMVYGIATVMGFNEGISNFLGGIFVPPGVEDDDYGDYDY